VRRDGGVTGDRGRERKEGERGKETIRSLTNRGKGRKQRPSGLEARGSRILGGGKRGRTFTTILLSEKLKRRKAKMWKVCNDSGLHHSCVLKWKKGRTSFFMGTLKKEFSFQTSFILHIDWFSQGGAEPELGGNARKKKKASKDYNRSLLPGKRFPRGSWTSEGGRGAFLFFF